LAGVMGVIHGDVEESDRDGTVLVRERVKGVK
jgi:hypothetical protein